MILTLTLTLSTLSLKLCPYVEGDFHLCLPSLTSLDIKGLSRLGAIANNNLLKDIS